MIILIVIALAMAGYMYKQYTDTDYALGQLIEAVIDDRVTITRDSDNIYMTIDLEEGD